MDQSYEKKQPMDLTVIISNAIQLPGVKVNRETFLRELFKTKSPEELSRILENGPVEAGCCDREELRKKANRIVKERTAFSTSASFLAGLPGGWAMAATIPADIIQFYGISLRMAQELVYLYGEKDLWCEETSNPDYVTKQLILYCGVMLGATGAAQSVRIMSAALAKQALKKLPQKALMKTVYYPVIKAILKFFGVSITKSTFAKGVSKALPVVGGVISGGITCVSMLPMGRRLVETLDKAHFDYTQKELERDMRVIDALSHEVFEDETTASVAQSLARIKEAKQMLDDGLITEDEYQKIKEKLIV